MIGLDAFLCFLLRTQNFVLDQSLWSETLTLWSCSIMQGWYLSWMGAGVVPLGIVLPLALQGGMLQYSSLAPGASVRVPTATFLANKCWFSVHFYRPSVISNGPLFIVLCCCVLGHYSLPNNRWKCGFIWVINYVLLLSTWSACFCSAFSHPWAPLVKDPFLALSSTNNLLLNWEKIFWICTWALQFVSAW